MVTAAVTEASFMFVFALGASLAWGASSSLAATTSRQYPAVPVVWGTQLVGLLCLGVYLAFVSSNVLRPIDIVAGAAGGLGSVVGLLSVYRGYAIGRIALVAPVSAMVAVGVPAVVGVLSGETMTFSLGLGLAAGTGAVTLLSGGGPGSGAALLPSKEGIAAAMRPTGGSATRGWATGLVASGLPHAALGGLGFSAFYIAMDVPSSAAGLWPLLAARGVSLTVLSGLVLIRGVSVGAPWRGRWREMAGIGVLDVLGAALFLFAVTRGPLSSATVLSNMHPVIAVILGRVVLGEQLGSRRTIGVLMALVGMQLIVLA